MTDCAGRRGREELATSKSLALEHGDLLLNLLLNHYTLFIVRLEMRLLCETSLVSDRGIPQIRNQPSHTPMLPSHRKLWDLPGGGVHIYGKQPFVLEKETGMPEDTIKYSLDT